MEAPEKLYIALNELDEDERTFVLEHRVDYPICTEYTRTDAFIEKACDSYCRLCDTKECGDTGECDWVEKFRKRLMR